MKIRSIILTKSILIFFIFFFGDAASQSNRKGLLKGILIDSVDQSPVEAATISLIYQNDSTSAGITLSRKNGAFKIEDISYGHYDCYISMSGYTTIVKRFSVSADNPQVNFDSLRLTRENRELSEILLVSAPVSIRNDTLEYNANAFRVPKNARLEELLKRLPGLKVEKDGSISFNGEKITEIMVDGKPFFYQDPKIVSKNLPADIFDKVQLFDKRSKENEIRKIDDGSTQKVLNLKIKKDRKKGIFGNFGAAYGTDERYSIQGSANVFNNEKQISIIGDANNINSVAFTGSGHSSGKGGGIIESKSPGINYRDMLDKKNKLSLASSYIHGSTKSMLEQISSKETLLPDSSFFTDMNTSNKDKNSYNRFHADIEYKPDTLNYLRLSADFNLNHSESATGNGVDMSDNHKMKINSSIQTRTNKNNGYNTGAGLSYIRSFKQTGRFLSVNFSFNNYYNKGEGYLNSLNNYYQAGARDSFSRKTISANGGSANTINILYSHSFGKGISGEVNIGRRESAMYDNQHTYDFNKASHDFDIENPGITRTNKNINTDYGYGSGVRLNKKKYNAYIGLNIQQLTQLYSIENQDSLSSTQQVFQNWKPSAFLNYNFSRVKKINVHYNGDTRQPTALQLSPLIDSTNRLSLSSGNPYLRPEYTHRISISYSNRDYSRWAPSLNISYATARNRITFMTTYDRAGIQITQPVNTNGNYYATASLSLNVPLRNKKITASFFIRPSSSADINFINGTKNRTTSNNILQGINFDYRGKKLLDINFSAAYSYSVLTYSLQPELKTKLSGIQLNAAPVLKLPGDWRLTLNFEFSQNSFSKLNRSFALLNGSVSKQFLKDNRGEISIRGFDLFNQNQSYYRTSSENYIEDIHTLVLNQYFLVSFTYGFSKFNLRK